MRFVEVDGLRASVIGLGGWQFGAPAWGWGRDWGPAEARAIYTRAMELGITVFDSAESYADGESEKALGDALARSPARDSLVVATKVSPNGLSRDRVRAAARASLERLGTGHIDHYQVHGMDWRVAESVKMAGMRDLLTTGEIRQVGVSNYDLAVWREAEAALGRPVISNQVRYSLLTRRAERELLPYAVANQRLIIAWSPLEQGLLTAKHSHQAAPPRFDRPSTEYFAPENMRRAKPVIDALREVAAAHNATPAQVALAWLVHHPNVVAIPGARSVAQLESNAAAGDLTLAGEELAHLITTADRFRPVPQPGQAVRQAVRQAARRAVRRVRQLAGVERLPDRH